MRFVRAIGKKAFRLLEIARSYSVRMFSDRLIKFRKFRVAFHN